MTNRKSHMGFRLVPKSVTLNDPAQRNNHNLCIISPNSVAFRTNYVSVMLGLGLGLRSQNVSLSLGLDLGGCGLVNITGLHKSGWKYRLRVKCGSADMRICGLNNG